MKRLQSSVGIMSVVRAAHAHQPRNSGAEGNRHHRHDSITWIAPPPITVTNNTAMPIQNGRQPRLVIAAL